MNRPDTDRVMCPYDKAHIIIKSRLQIHLTKCRKNFPNAEKSSCQFNSSHVVPTLELHYHMMSCEDNAKIVRDTYVVGDVRCPVKDSVPIEIELPPSEENWEEEPDVVSPLEMIRQTASEKNILLTNGLIGQSKAKRKDFRQREVQRHQAMKNESEREQANKQLRMPLEVKMAPQPNETKSGPLRLPHASWAMCEEMQKQEMIKPPSPKLSRPPQTQTKQKIDVASRLRKPYEALGSSGKNSDSAASVAGSLSRLSIDDRSYCGSVVDPKDKRSVSPSLEMTRMTVPRFQNRSSPSASSVASCLSEDARFELDANGFLNMPIPGVGRGKR